MDNKINRRRMLAGVGVVAGGAAFNGLSGIVSADELDAGDYVVPVNTIDNLKSIASVVGETFMVKERCNGVFNSVLTSTVTPNGYDVVQSTYNSGISYVLVVDCYNPKKFGAVANGVVNDLPVLNYVLSTYGALNLGSNVNKYAISGGSLDVGFFCVINSCGATIIQLDSNRPIVKISSSRWEISNVFLRYASQQSALHTKSYGVIFDAAFEGVCKNIMVMKAYRGFGVNNSNVFDGSSYAYMLSLFGCRSLDHYDWGFYFSNDGSAGMTTTSLINCYAVQGSNSNVNIFSKGFYVSNHSGGFLMLNCAADKHQGGTVLLIQSCSNFTSTGMDVESNVIYNNSLITVSSSVNVDIAGISFVENKFSGVSSIFKSNGQGRYIKVSGRERNSTNMGTLYGVQASSDSEQSEIDAFNFISDGGFPREDNLTPNSKRQIYSYNHKVYAEKSGVGSRVEYRSSCPISGFWSVGDIIKNHSPSNINPITEWICIIAGTPGKWRPVSSVTVKGSTEFRPALLSGDFGVTYIDTTLQQYGKPIWWNGSSWIDASGVIV